ESEGPQRWQLRFSGKVGICLYHLVHFRTIEKIIVHFPTVCPKTGDVPTLMGKIEMGPKGVIEKNTVRLIVVEPYIKRDGLVQRILVLSERILIGGPVVHALPLKVGVCRLVAKSVKTF